MILALVMFSCVVEPEKSATDPLDDQPVDGGHTGDDTAADDSGDSGDSGRSETGETGETGSVDSGETDTGDDTGTIDTGDDTSTTDSSTVDTGAADTSTADTATADTGIEPEPDLVPDFTLEDLNPTSVRYAEMVSPRDYLEQVSGWYFIHAT